MMKGAFFFFVSALMLAGGSLRTPTIPRSAAEEGAFDVVISGGRVMDPESGLDAVRNVGIRDGKIVEISEKTLQGKQSIDAHGLVVAPGFIDLHEHGQEPRNYEFQAHDGVTTSLELEAGTADVSTWYARRAGKSLINFGVSAGHIPVRMRVMNDPGKWMPTGPAAHKAATPAQLRAIQQELEAGLKAGALAVGMGINYTEAATHQEILEVFRVAAKYQAPVHVHVRFAGAGEPSTGLAAVEEVIAAAASTGVPLHVVHITSIGLAQTPQLIQLVEGAQRHGLDVTTECYPYVAASTALESALFDPGWQERMGITFKDIQWAKTGERLTAETFEKYRIEGGAVVIYSIPEAAALEAVRNPIVMIGSDGMPITGAKVHPRGQGTFSRVLGHYVREERALDLMTALRKMTLMPAQRLEKRAPDFRNKGRIRMGADADITVFNPATIIDKATFEDPLQYSAGISFVLVNGVPVLMDGKLVENVFPGRAARAPIQQ
ncbi:MAG TPA: amidohydrolase family protein [Candidatus Limnocylindrales bacterium]|nr:amidohydrolase family protein [Candidatus Limnocylindrales bacterium]